MERVTAIGATLACAMLFASCSKVAEQATPPPTAAQPSGEQVLNITVNSGDTYTVSYDKASDLNIHKQAAHFRESTTSVNNETGLIVYRYAPAEGFTGTDEVTLSSVKKMGSYSSGCFRGSYGDEPDQILMKTFTKLKINVTK